MNRLDFGEIVDSTDWLEVYDTMCPFCNGDGRIGDEEECDDCGGTGYFEIMWNTGFSVEPRYGYISSRSTWEEMYKDAWRLGFLLIDHGGEYYLLAGGCGYDFTWQLHYARWVLQNNRLDLEDIHDMLSSWGGHVFLGDEEKTALLDYMRKSIPTPEEYARSYTNDMDRIDMIAKEIK